VFPPIGWPAVAVALIFLLSRIIWSRAAWWRFVAGVVALVIVAAGRMPLAFRPPSSPTGGILR
jgi:hypothetical protein